MSTWGQGGSRATRNTRNHVLERDNHTCRLQLPGCTNHATQAHHTHGLQGQRRLEATNPDDMIAVCQPCHDIITEQQRRTAYTAKQKYRNQRRHLPTRPHPGD